MSLLARSKNVFNALAASPARLPTRIEIPSKNVDEPGKLGAPLSRNQCYFQIRVNEMFLAEERQWFKTFFPMVYVGTEFQYDGEEVAIPFVIGPDTLGPAIGNGSQDVVFRNTRVAGISPYRGGRLSMTLVLYRVTETNLSENLLGMVERLAGALDFATAISVYTKIAGALLDGIELLTGDGGTSPVLGHRIELDPDAGDEINPAYFAFVDMPEEELGKYTLWIVKDRLMHGPSMDQAKPFRDADFVLTSIASTPERSDMDMLSFSDTWKRVLKEAAVPSEDGYTSAKSNLVSLAQTMLLSPDLIEEHAELLSDDYGLRMQSAHLRAVKRANLSDEEDDDMSRTRSASLKMLDL
ncbi:MAG: hypothetical protein AAGI36_04720 [Pseudomonadota bacterium]